MPDRRTHRGAHPEDARLFAPSARPPLRKAVGDLCWLLSRGYADVSSLKLVGDRHRLTKRQRVAVMRCACSDAALADRRRRCVPLDRLRGAPLLLDGYNCLTTVEAALGGGVILAARDGAFRDMASVHGTYRKVAETAPAIELLGGLLAELGAAACLWYLDSPVSNSGRLKTLLLASAREHGWDWQVELVTDPDPVLAASDGIVATADSVVLDRCRRWVNLARAAIERHVPQANLVDLAGE